MGQLSAELNYERRMKRYEEEVENHILNSVNWEEELELYLEGAMEHGEHERVERSEDKASEEEPEKYEDYSIMLVAANLSEDEKHGVEEWSSERNETVISEGLILLEKSGEGKELEEGIFPALEMGDYLRDLVVEGIEVSVEGSLEKVEEDIDKELGKEERKQEELGNEELFESYTRAIEIESEEPLERILEGSEKYERPEKEYERPEKSLKEEYELLREEFAEHKPAGEFVKEDVKELVEEFVREKVVEKEEEKGLEESVEEVEERSGLEGEFAEYERSEEEFETLMGEFEEYERELESSKEELGEIEKPIEESKEYKELEEEIEEAEEKEGVVEEAVVKEVSEEVREEEEEKETEGMVEEVEEAGREGVGENLEQGIEGEAKEEEVEGKEGAQEQGVEGGEEGGGGPPEAVAAGGEEEPRRKSAPEDFTAREEVETGEKGGPVIHEAKVRIDWSDLGHYERLNLRYGVLQKLVKEGIKKVGTKTELAREVGLPWATLHNILSGKRNIISVGNFKDLLDFLGVPYEDMNRQIIGMGGPSHPDSIKDPHLPFNFGTPEGATLIAAALKDGCISESGHYFRYTNKDEENIERIKKAVKKVFGYTKPREVREDDLIIITYPSHVIERAMREAGVPHGRKTKKEYHVPEFIRRGDEEVQKAYLYQTLMDEGAWEVSKYSEVYDIKYRQAISIDEKLTEDDKKILEKLDREEHEMPYHGRGERYHIYYTYISSELEMKMRKEFPCLWEIIDKSKPPNIEEEKEMFEELFDVHVKLRPSEIYFTESGGYRVTWELRVDGKDQCHRIMKELNLPLHKHKDEESS